ncbi:16S rRNA pseudouridine(516) synthase RsuA [Catenovulum sp. SM1970]|uniref:16S rRNA pseudouridine(516) synthase RsuA n=1 Tax=Marinifaba aquimaris TaxID=2741323 RepID=UPI00157403D2|nr:16S rRNA pseudouridine(516) synthase RsuA [Marinifaba aquimaris]NTS78900.1 16S rRNA pseudouridine(516) synthase RsuA [Marinifaba aquimaris]
MPIRLDKFICENTELTRKQAKVRLHRGEVTVDGEVVKNSALKIAETADVCIDGESISLIGARYIMLYKPAEFICSNIDEVYPSVLNILIDDGVSKIDKLHTAGRLDADTTGLVLITDDGQWSHNITSPNKDCQKRYRVETEKVITDSMIEQLEQGVQLHNEDGLTKPATVEKIDDYELLLTISEGKYHQVKRMLAAVGNRVESLHREQIGQVELDQDLEIGEWRYLTDDEIACFK